MDESPYDCVLTLDLLLAFPHPQAAWWTTPLLGAGRFA